MSFVLYSKKDIDDLIKLESIILIIALKQMNSINLKIIIIELNKYVKKKKIGELIKYFRDGTVEYNTVNKSKFHLIHDDIIQSNASIRTIQKIEKGTFLRSVIDCKIERKYKVPTQKPQELLRRLILLTSNENDIILDPFCGSGSLGLAAKQIDRDFILIEKDEEYYNIAKQNIEEYLNNSLFK